MNKELFWKDMIHTSNNGLQQLVRHFIKHLRFRKFSLLTALLITYFIFVKHLKVLITYYLHGAWTENRIFEHK